MRPRIIFSIFTLSLLLLVQSPVKAGWARTVYEVDSLYHHIRVVDDGGDRLLRFDNSIESMMKKSNPFLGHFEYVDFFFQTFVLKPDIENCLMMGLGGASAPKLMQHHFRGVEIDIVEIDEMVFEIAQDYFSFNPADTTDVTIQDARVFLKKSDEAYDLILMDAYTANKYGSYVPFHLATLEFFELVDEHLSDDGIFAFNVIGTIHGERKEIMASIYRTLSEVFPNLYMFPAESTQNVVIIASKSDIRLMLGDWRTGASDLFKAGIVGLYPEYVKRAWRITDIVPPKWWDAQLLTDDFAPIDGLLK